MTETATQHKNNVEWGQAKGFSKYLISTDGQVYSLKRDRLLPQGYTQRGYKQVDVCNDEGIKKHMRVHRLVYMAHKGVIPEGMRKLMGHTTPYQYFTKHLYRYNEWVQNNPDKAKTEGLEELPIIPLHGLRHSCATLLNYLEINIIEISKTLGHSTCSTTMNIYAHSFEEQQEEVATKVNEFLRLNA